MFVYYLFNLCNLDKTSYGWAGHEAPVNRYNESSEGLLAYRIAYPPILIIVFNQDPV